MLGAAMKGELGPLAQAVAKYQMERKIRTEVEKLKLKEEELEKNQTANKNDQDVSSSLRCFVPFFFFSFLFVDNEYFALPLQAAVSDNWLSRWRQEISQSPQDNVPSSTPVQDQNDREIQRRIGQPTAKSAAGKDKLGELTKLYKPQNANNAGSAA